METAMQEWKTRSEHWQERIGELQEKAESASGRVKDATLELIESLEQQKTLIDQYIKQLEKEGRKSWDKAAAELDRMFRDVDDAYRKAISHFHH
jgi:F0F1-type ATP synthase membrane subunit b/b'